MAVDPLDPLLEALPEQVVWHRIATVTGTSPLNIQFDGETAASSRTYTRLSSYTPSVGDRVLLSRISSTWVVLGKIV
jgi:hypothetical protein